MTAFEYYKWIPETVLTQLNIIEGKQDGDAETARKEIERIICGLISNIDKMDKQNRERHPEDYEGL